MKKTKLNPKHLYAIFAFLLSAVVVFCGVQIWQEYSSRQKDIDAFAELSELAEIKEPDEPKAVVTVIESKGSSPRGAGAKMIVYRDGRILGSIGGGCSEAAVLGEARSLIGSGRYKVVHVDLTGEAAEDEGMVCGGIMDVLVEDFATDREPCDR